MQPPVKDFVGVGYKVLNAFSCDLVLGTFLLRVSFNVAIFRGSEEVVAQNGGQ
jgi:hypothetical protein